MVFFSYSRTEKNLPQRWMFKMISCEESVKYWSSISFLECILHCNTSSSHPGCLMSQQASIVVAFTPQKWKRSFLTVTSTSERSRMTFVPDVRWHRYKPSTPKAHEALIGSKLRFLLPRVGSPINGWGVTRAWCCSVMASIFKAKTLRNTGFILISTL